jgi:multiple sugar transport system substrate-binding protein
MGQRTTRRQALAGLTAAAPAATGVLAACGAPSGGAGELPRAGTREVTLRYVMHQDNSEIPTYEGIAQLFTQKLPKVRVAVEPIPWDDYPPKITAMLAGGTPPDCCYQASRRVIGFVANGQTVDLNALVKQDREAKREAYWGGTIEENTWRGALFGWPSDAVGVPVAVNRSLLQQRGARLPAQYVTEKKWTWEAVLEVARRVSGDGVFGLPLRDWDGDWPNWIYQNGGEILNKDRTESLIHRPEAYEAIQYSVDLIYRHKVAPAFNQQPWAEGQLALTLAHPNNVQSWRKTLAFDWDIVPLWTHKAAGSTLFTGATTLFKDSPNVAEAWEFAKYFGGPEAEKERIVKNGRTPALKALQEEYVKILEPAQPPANARLFLEALDYSRPLPITPAWTEMRQVIGEQLKPVWAGERPAKDATAEITRLVNPLLAPFARK